MAVDEPVRWCNEWCWIEHHWRRRTSRHRRHERPRRGAEGKWRSKDAHHGVGIWGAVCLVSFPTRFHLDLRLLRERMCGRCTTVHSATSLSFFIAVQYRPQRLFNARVLASPTRCSSYVIRPADDSSRVNLFSSSPRTSLCFAFRKLIWFCVCAV